jgi:hypothetical protein
MASQIQPWEREVKDGLATLSSTTAPNPLQQLLLVPPHRPSTSLTRQTRKRGSQQGLTHNFEMKEENKAWHCLASTPSSYTISFVTHLGPEPSPSLVPP